MVTHYDEKLTKGTGVHVRYINPGFATKYHYLSLLPGDSVTISVDPLVPPPVDPPPSTTCTRVATAPIGGADATAGLLADLAATPNGGTLCLVAGATYVLKGEWHIQARSNITIDGRGAILKRPAATGSSMFGILGVNGITVRNLTLDGAKPYAQGDLSLEGNHGIRFDGSTAGLFENVTIRNVGGDGIMLGAGYVPGRKGSDGFEFRNGVIDGTGRNAFSITDGGDHSNVHHNVIRNVGYYTFDIEPNGYVDASGVALGGRHVAFTDNQIGPNAYAYVPAVHGYVFAITGSSGPGPGEDVTFARNVISGLPFRIGVFDNGGTRKDIRVTDNRTDTPTNPLIPREVRFAGVTGLTVTGNTGFPNSAVSVTNCTNVTISGNT